MKKYWVVYGLFISYPDKEETWHELETYDTYDKAFLNARNTNQDGIPTNGYFDFRIIERTYTDKILKSEDMDKWIEFKAGQYPRTGETIVVRNDAYENPIYEYLIYVEDGPVGFCRYHDHSTKLSFHGLTHWQLVDSPY